MRPVGASAVRSAAARIASVMLGGAGTGRAAVRICRSMFARSVGRAIASRSIGFTGFAIIAVASALQSGQPVQVGSCL